MPDLEPGLSATLTRRVEERDGATALGSGDVPVLGTPRLVALAEEATVAAVAPALGPTETSVGVRVEIDHLRATPIGDTVTVDAMLSRVDGRRLTFEVGATDSEGSVGRGTVVRVVVDRERFLAGLGGPSYSA